MNSKLLVPLVLTLSLNAAFVNAAQVKTHKHVTAIFKTHDGKIIRCLVPREDESDLRLVKRGASVMLSDAGFGQWYQEQKTGQGTWGGRRHMGVPA